MGAPELFLLSALAMSLVYYTLSKLIQNSNNRSLLEAQTRYREAVNETLKAVAQIADSDPDLAKKLSEQLLSNAATRPLLEENYKRPKRVIPTRL